MYQANPLTLVMKREDESTATVLSLPASTPTNTPDPSTRDPESYNKGKYMDGYNIVPRG